MISIDERTRPTCAYQCETANDEVFDLGGHRVTQLTSKCNLQVQTNEANTWPNTKCSHIKCTNNLASTIFE